MASTPLPPDAALEAYAHCCSASQVQEHLTRSPRIARKWLRAHGHTAVARSMKFNKDFPGVMGVLLKHPEIQVNLQAFGGEERNTLLHLAVQEDDDKSMLLLQLLLKRPDLDPNVGNSKGDAPLHDAARASSAPCVDSLLEDPRVNVAAVNYNRQTCLHSVCDATTKETSVMVQTSQKIIKRIPQIITKQDLFGNTGLHYAAARGLENVVRVFFEADCLGNKHELAVKQNHQGKLAIHLAVLSGHHGVVKLMLGLVDESHVDEVVVNIEDQAGFGLLHHAVLSGCTKILQHCIDRLQKPTKPTRYKSTFDFYMDLLAKAPNKEIADIVLKKFNADETVKNSEGEEDDYLANLLHFAVSEDNGTLVKRLVHWYPQRAVVAMHEAMKTTPGKKTIQAVLSDHPEVQRDFEKMRKANSEYVTAANAILVVAVLIIGLTFNHCKTSFEAAQHRKELSELKDYGGPPEVMKLQGIDFLVLPTWAFFQAMVATIFSAFASLPFSFAFFFHEAVDDTKVKQLQYKTRVLIVSASYFLVLSLEALFFSFVCSQFIAPCIDYKCTLACEVALSVFFLCATLFLGFNFVQYWRNRTKDEEQATTKFTKKLKITITR